MDVEVARAGKTFAGNLTIVGSAANMIVIESARDHLQIGFWDYARFGIPITIITTVVGVSVLLVLHREDPRWRSGVVTESGFSLTAKSGTSVGPI